MKPRMSTTSAHRRRACHLYSTPFLVYVEPGTLTFVVMRGADAGLIRLVCRNCATTPSTRP
jgi:hypothetical protein